MIISNANSRIFSTAENAATFIGRIRVRLISKEESRLGSARERVVSNGRVLIKTRLARSMIGGERFRFCRAIEITGRDFSSAESRLIRRR